MIAMAVKQTAGRDTLGTFAPEFARLNDDILFGEVWSRESLLSLRDRSLVTVVSLMAQGLVDSSFRYHLETARKNGIKAGDLVRGASKMLGGGGGGKPDFAQGGGSDASRIDEALKALEAEALKG